MEDSNFQDRTLLKHAVLEKALIHVSFSGWQDDVITEALKDLEQDPSWNWRLFPEGTRDLLEFWSLSLDQKMLEILNQENTATLKIREKIALAVQTRIRLLIPHRDAAIQASRFFLRPQHAPLALRLVAKTVSEIWYWAGDRSTDYNYYTKRILLGGVYSSTLAYWLKDTSADFEKTWLFLNKRIENVLALSRWKRR